MANMKHIVNGNAGNGYSGNPLIAQLILKSAKNRLPDISDVETAKKIYDATPKPADGKDALAAHLKFVIESDRLKTGRFGRKAPTNGVNFLQMAHCALLVEGIANNPDEIAATRKKVDEVKAELSCDDYHQDWLLVKTEIFGAMLVQKEDALRYALGLKTPFGASALGKISEAAGIGNVAGAMADAICELHKYGVKTSFFQDGITHGAGQAWLFWDPIILLSDLNRKMKWPDGAAMAAATLSDISSIKAHRQLKLEEVETEHAALPDGNNLFTLNVGGYLLSYIMKDGELCCSQYGFLPMKRIFADAGAEGQYEMLRLMQMLRLYDLTVPIEVARTMPKLPSAGGFAGNIIARLLMKKNKPITPELVLPRIKTLEAGGLARKLEVEIEEADEKTHSRAVKREHEVVGHIRVLPESYRHSARAEEEAGRYGIKLAENETFIRPHKRGSGEHVGIHRARQG